MFTGIIRHYGTLHRRRPTTLTIKTEPALNRTLKRGDSIAVNGTCLTITARTRSSFCVNVMPETLKRTTLGTIPLKSMLNLERPATPTTFLDGHIVQGHIDCTGRVRSMTKEGNSRIINVGIPKNWAKYIVEKGSVAIDGVSLTVINVKPTSLTVGIIPHTWSHTIFHRLNIGDHVNIETDNIAKHIYHLLHHYA